jgi:putative colanic acid biosynthesis acetyltransferase WcaF
MKTIQDLSSFQLPQGFRGRSAVTVQLWWLTQSLLFKTSPQLFYGWRRFLLRLFGAKIGQGVMLRPSVTVTYPWKVTIGNHSWIGDDVVLYSLGEIVIGNNVVISQKSYLCAASHDYTSTDFKIFSKKIIIEDQSWIATDVFVAPGVTIGIGAVVGARSSVFKSIEGGLVYGGNPLGVIKKR